MSVGQTAPAPAFVDRQFVRFFILVSGQAVDRRRGRKAGTHRVGACNALLGLKPGADAESRHGEKESREGLAHV